MVEKPLPFCGSPGCGDQKYLSSGGYLICRSCNRKKAARYNKENPERASEYQKKYYEENRSKLLEQFQDYSKRNRAKLSAAAKIWRDNMGMFYQLWLGINRRCHDPNSKDYKNYNERGISVLEDWRLVKERTEEAFAKNRVRFEAFRDYILSTLGPKPSKSHSLDRINNSGNYEPGNLKWSTPKEQANNRRSNIKHRVGVSDDIVIFHEGSWQSLDQFSEASKIKPIVVKYRFALSPEADFILGRDIEQRYYEYEEAFYNITELSLISGLPYATMFARVKNPSWSIKAAVETPLA